MSWDQLSRAVKADMQTVEVEEKKSFQNLIYLNPATPKHHLWSRVLAAIQIRKTKQ